MRRDNPDQVLHFVKRLTTTVKNEFSHTPYIVLPQCIVAFAGIEGDEEVQRVVMLALRFVTLPCL